MQLQAMNDDLGSLDERELKRRIFGTFSPSTPPSSQASHPDTSETKAETKPSDEVVEAAAVGGGSILICKKCGCLLPVCEGRIDMLVRHAGLEARPAGRFYFTSEICFMCSEKAALFVPPVTLVRVPDETQSPDTV